MAHLVSVGALPARHAVRARANDQISGRMGEWLDRIRGIAAGLVVLYNIRTNVPFDQNALIAHGTAGWLVWVVHRNGDSGPQAVLWFVIISGFLIGGRIADDVGRSRFDAVRHAIAQTSRLYVVMVPAIMIGSGMDLTRVTSFGADPQPGLQPYGWLPAGWAADLLVLICACSRLVSRLTEVHAAKVRDALHHAVDRAYALPG